ncbi:hypothetical protein BpHYR1_023339 [Brachionus plicatilis]|uniref:Uncharacterized protein n=1 Tax=Brachionus plicatilis TaxID=10195 RepID=A0A3M7SSA0_BRAPC|nr:hypothetical protein BpHYR1_023339 [Brachionus plicatilis]
MKIKTNDDRNFGLTKLNKMLNHQNFPTAYQMQSIPRLIPSICSANVSIKAFKSTFSLKLFKSRFLIRAIFDNPSMPWVTSRAFCKQLNTFPLLLALRQETIVFYDQGEYLYVKILI